MGETRISLPKPGIDLELSQTTNRGGWSIGNLIRFRFGVPEKIGGWKRIMNASVTGICRTLHYWIDLSSNTWLACGTNSNLQVVQNVVNGPVLSDITPAGYAPGLVSSGGTLFSLRIWSLDNFGQNLIAIPSGGPIYQWIPSIPTTLATPITDIGATLTGGEVSPELATWQAIADGGFSITINGMVVNVVGLNFSGLGSQADIAAAIQAALGAAVVVTPSVAVDGNWTFIVATIATGATATLTYAIPPAAGVDISSMLGWSASTAASLAQGDIPPPFNQGGFVAMPSQILVVYGSTPLGADTLDPMTVRWSDQSNYLVWTPSTTNQAGSFRLSRGSRINGAIQTPLGAFLWTDVGVWAMQYIAFPLVFAFIEIAENCGLIAQNAVAVLGSVPYWMSDHGFFRMGSTGAEQIPCSVWDFVYKNLDSANQDKCVAATDYHYSEVFFYFPSKSGGTGEIDSYVKYNTQENLWDCGNLVRTAWTDLNQPGGPYGVDQNGRIQKHEVGYDADDEPMLGSYVESGYVDLANGKDIELGNRFMPDFLWDGPTPNVNVSLLFRNFPGEAPSESVPMNIEPSTEFVSILSQLVPYPIMGIRGREVAMTIDFSPLGSWARFGTPRIRSQPDGRL